MNATTFYDDLEKHDGHAMTAYVVNDRWLTAKCMWCDKNIFRKDLGLIIPSGGGLN